MDRPKSVVESELFGSTPSVERSRIFTTPVYWTADRKPVTLRDELGFSAQTFEFLEEAIALLNTKNRANITEEIDLRRETGFASIVATKRGDDICYAVRPHRRKYSRFVRGSEPTPTNKLTIVLAQKRELDLDESQIQYILKAAWIGPKPMPEAEEIMQMYKHSKPARQLKQREYMRLRSLQYWRRHAYVLERVKHDPKSLTTNPPPGFSFDLEPVSPND